MLVLLLPGVAAATTTVTLHLSGVAIDVGPAGCVPGELFLTGNAVFHQTINDAGDTWITETAEGTATATGFSGHGAAWFGLEGNRSNFVTHFIADGVGTTTAGTALMIHVEGQFTLNANFVPVVNRITVTCR
jgi:hypothetical protein